MTSTVASGPGSLPLMLPLMLPLPLMLLMLLREPLLLLLTMLGQAQRTRTRTQAQKHEQRQRQRQRRQMRNRKWFRRSLRPSIVVLLVTAALVLWVADPGVFDQECSDCYCYSSGRTATTFSAAVETFAHAYAAKARDTSAATGLLRMELFPTSSLVVRRQKGNRRRLRMGTKPTIVDETELETELELETETEEWPEHWFHPQSRAVYATLHPDFGGDDDDGNNDDRETEQQHQHQNQHRHYQDFVDHRHLSRYERFFRESLGLNLHANWQGNYSDPGDLDLELHDERRLLRAVLRAKARAVSRNNTSTAFATVNATVNANATAEYNPKAIRRRNQRRARNSSSSSSSSSNNTAAANYNNLFPRSQKNNHIRNHNDNDNDNGTIVPTKSKPTLMAQPRRRTRQRQQQQRFRHNRRRELLESLVGGTFDRYQGIPLSQGYGTHYVHLWVGAPIPQRQTVIVDTGSHFTGFPVAGECKNCGESHHTDPHFDPSKSESFRALVCPHECVEHHFECEAAPGALVGASDGSHHGRRTPPAPSSPRCRFKQAYTEGSSWTAYQAKDVVYCGSGADLIEAVDPLDTQYAIPFVFGCLQENTGLFQTQLADGIMGMSAHELTLPKQLYNEGKIEYNMFAMCFRKELGTSQKGVTAGSMTLGGVSSILDTSPMVYARNLRPFGWYTVYLESVYVATKGGHRFVFDDPDRPPSWYKTYEGIVRLLSFDPVQVNRDRGVIVDSGTTDTYIPSSIREEFSRVWKEATGNEYSNGATVLTQFQVQKLPTLLLQFRASPSHSNSNSNSNSNTHDNNNNNKNKNNNNNNNNNASGKPVLGQVGYLDPTRRDDVLLAIPATSYMEYSPTLKVYTSRLFFTETKGGVIGANSMQGHNILFDWHHGRIGFAQSSCAYDLLAGKNDNHQDFVGAGTDLLVEQCHLASGIPTLTQTCWDSIVSERNLPGSSGSSSSSSSNNNALFLCEESFDPTNVEVAGTEIWTLRVELPGIDPSACEAAMRDWSESRDTTHQVDRSTTECTPDGLCHEYRPCHVPCPDAMAYKRQMQLETENEPQNEHEKQRTNTKTKTKKPTSTSEHRSKSTHKTTMMMIRNEAVTIPQPVVSRTTETEDLRTLCPEWMWSACDHSCSQSRSFVSGAVTHTNGHYCIESSRETRSCHLGACGRSDPCIVPFLVHAIFVLEAAAEEGNGDDNDNHNDNDNNNAWTSVDDFWTPEIEEDFRWKLTYAAHHPRVYDGESVLFGVGDVNVLVARPWYGGDDDEEVDTAAPGDHHTNDGDKDEDHTAKKNTEANASAGTDPGGVAGRSPRGVQLILQISISNPKAILDKQQRQQEQEQHGSGRLLLQEVGVVWSNLTSVFRPSKPTSVCDPFDLYPLAKTANLVADQILASSAFLKLLAVGSNDNNNNNNNNNQYKDYDDDKDGDDFFDFEQRTGAKTHLDDERATTLLAGISSAKLVSSWTIGTQIYDDSVNYLGPLASTPLFPVIKILHEAFLVIIFVWLVTFAFKSVRLVRVGVVRVVKKWKKRNSDSYQDDPISRDDDDETTLALSSNSSTSYDYDETESSCSIELSSLLALLPSAGASATKNNNSARIEMTTTTTTTTTTSHLGSRVKKRITR